MTPCPRLAAAVAAATLAANLTVSADTGWTSAGTTRGVTLAFRDVADLGAREVRATAELRFDAASIFAIVCDFSYYRETSDDVEEARVLAGTVPDGYEIYLRYAPRFVVIAARDVVLQVRKETREHETLGCGWTELAGRVPERKGVVRMPLLRGLWTLEPIDESRTRVAYQVAVKPGGRIPGWLVRRGAVKALPDVIERVRTCLERRAQAPPDRPLSCRA
jgi:hypothetical protein